MSWSNASEQRDRLDTRGLVNALRTVPEFRITLIKLARKVTKRGKVDLEKASFYREELDQAIDEAKAYGKDTRKAVACLKRLVR